LGVPLRSAPVQGLPIALLDTTPKTARPTWLVKKVRLAGGKVRRFYLHKFRRAYVEDQVAKRQGDCGRCAACCKLLFICPFLDESGPMATCSIHDRRPDNCRFFPIDPRDLADRDFIDPNNPCGFFFPGASGGKPVAREAAASANGHGSRAVGPRAGAPPHGRTAMEDIDPA